MNILFDFNHPVDVNFFKNAIKILSKSGHNVVITYRDRGRLAEIAKYELGEFAPIKIGQHQKTFIKKITGQLKRDLEFLSFQRRKKIDISVCFGTTNAIASWLNGIPYLAFDDDFEYKIPFYHANIFSTRHIMPAYIRVNKKNIYHYNGLKELAYLHPHYFSPRVDELKRYEVLPGKYVFIREIANVSLNYQKQNTSINEIVNTVKNLGLKVVLSLENKDLKFLYERDCIILEEPVKDIYSLMKFALFAVSSGDSVARETALLGTPTIYTGGRDMAVNEELINIGCMFKEDKLENIIEQIARLSIKGEKERITRIVADKIRYHWEDTTEVILRHISNFEK
jgi:predicted glycosyltransferase